MKTNNTKAMKITKLLLLSLVLSIGSTFAQKGVEDGSKYGHGEDSIRCLRNASLYNEYYKQKNFDAAFPAWEIVFNECPLAYSGTYSRGVNMLKYFYEKETDAVKKEELYQYILKVYEQRIKYFGKSKKYPKSYIIGSQAVDMLELKRDDDEVKVQAYALLKESIADRGNNSQPAVVVPFFTNGVVLFKMDKVSAEEVVNNFTTVSEILDANIVEEKDEKKKEAYKGAKNELEKMFAASGAADCSTIESIFAPQLEANKDNLEWLKKTTRLLNRTGCEETELFANAAEYQHAIEPSSESAVGIAIRALRNKDFDKAIGFYKEAISLCEDSEDKAKFYHQLALVLFNQGSLSAAKANALKSIEALPTSGKPYILLGQIYATDAKNYGKDEFEHKTVYWAAVDKFKKAKAVDASIADEANKMINLYSQYFPAVEEIFFQGKKEGESYTVGGWINETTTVRAK